MVLGLGLGLGLIQLQFASVSCRLQEGMEVLPVVGGLYLEVGVGEGVSSL